eukprot:14030518-Heterocapsa_arctica.AAC.1
MAHYKPATKAADDSFQGPSAIPELNDVLRGSGGDLAGFQDYWGDTAVSTLRAQPRTPTVR